MDTATLLHRKKIKDKLLAQSLDDQSIDNFFVLLKETAEFIGRFINYMSPMEDMESSRIPTSSSSDNLKVLQTNTSTQNAQPSSSTSPEVIQTETSPQLAQTSTPQAQKRKTIPNPELYHHPHFIIAESFKGNQDYDFSINPNYRNLLTTINEDLNNSKKKMDWALKINNLRRKPDQFYQDIIAAKENFVLESKKLIETHKELVEEGILKVQPTPIQNVHQGAPGAIPPPPPGAIPPPPPPPGIPPAPVLPKQMNLAKAPQKVNQTTPSDNLMDIVELNDDYEHKRSQLSKYEQAKTHYEDARNTFMNMLFPFHTNLILIWDPLERDCLPPKDASNVLEKAELEEIIRNLESDINSCKNNQNSAIKEIKPEESESSSKIKLDASESAFIAKLQTLKSKINKCQEEIKGLHNSNNKIVNEYNRASLEVKREFDSGKQILSKETNSRYEKAQAARGELSVIRKQLAEKQEQTAPNLITEGNKLINGHVNSHASNLIQMIELIERSIFLIQNKEPLPFTIPQITRRSSIHLSSGNTPGTSSIASNRLRSIAPKEKSKEDRQMEFLQERIKADRNNHTKVTIDNQEYKLSKLARSYAEAYVFGKGDDSDVNNSNIYKNYYREDLDKI